MKCPGNRKSTAKHGVMARTERERKEAVAAKEDGSLRVEREVPWNEEQFRREGGRQADRQTDHREKKIQGNEDRRKGRRKRGFCLCIFCVLLQVKQKRNEISDEGQK